MLGSSELIAQRRKHSAGGRLTVGESAGQMVNSTSVNATRKINKKTQQLFEISAVTEADFSIELLPNPNSVADFLKPNPEDFNNKSLTFTQFNIQDISKTTLQLTHKMSALSMAHLPK